MTWQPLGEIEVSSDWLYIPETDNLLRFTFADSSDTRLIIASYEQEGLDNYIFGSRVISAINPRQIILLDHPYQPSSDGLALRSLLGQPLTFTLESKTVPTSNPGVINNTINTVTPFATATPASVTLTANTSATALAANAARVFASFTNNGSADIWINYGATATVGQGIVLKGGGGNHEINAANPYTGVVSAISASAGTLAVLGSNG